MNNIQQQLTNRVKPMIEQQTKALKETRELIEKYRKAGFSVAALQNQQLRAENRLQQLRELL